MAKPLVFNETGQEMVNALNIIALGVSGGISSVPSWAAAKRFVQQGFGKQIFPVGTQVLVEKAASITASKGDSTGITGASVVQATFLEKMGGTHSGVYEATYDGTAWHKEDGTTILLSEYGITVTGTPVEGDHVLITEATTQLIFDVVDHDGYKNPADSNAHTMTLLLHDCIYGRPVDSPELLWCNTGTEALAAGTYNITLLHGAYNGSTSQDGTYEFTITQPIPVNGGFKHSAIGVYQSSTYTKAQITGGTFTTYNAAGEIIESGLTTTEASTGTSLGTASYLYTETVNTVGRFNSTQRQMYGSNNWGESNIRQWLNSEAVASAWFTKQTVFDCKAGYDKVAGFLNGIDADFLAAIGNVNVVTRYNSVFEEGGNQGSTTYTTSDKMFLASRDEIGYGIEGIAQGTVFSMYDGAAQANKIKYDIVSPGTARYWWLRSPYPSHGYYVRLVHPSGALNNNTATIGYGCAPACVIY